MRFPAACPFLLVSLAACAHQTATAPAAPATDPGRADPQTGGITVVDDAAFFFSLPGQWEKHAVDGGYDFRRGTEEQVIVTRLPSSSQDDATNVDTLSSAQQRAIPALCKRGALVGTPQRMPAGRKEPLLLVGVHASCEEPRVVATFVAVSSQGTVLSYEHYRYDAAKTTPDLGSVDATMFASLHIKAPTPATAACPDTILAHADSQEGMCLEAAVLGEAVVADCGAKLRGRGWQRDDLGAKLIGQQTGKTIVCYHAAAKH
jgi:hypothetical protein